MNLDNIHPSGISQKIVDKVIKRRGRMHAFENLDPSKTALVVIDLDTRTMEAPDNHRIRALAPKVNAIVNALRVNGGTIAWVTSPIRKASPNFIALYGETFSKMHEVASVPGGNATTVWKGLNKLEGDILAEKEGTSAFFPGRCNLHQQLSDRSIQSILIVGMVTNVCCESSARDATELGYQVTMISDAMWGHKEGQHEATLATFFRNFGDVRTCKGVVSLIEQS